MFFQLHPAILSLPAGTPSLLFRVVMRAALQPPISNYRDLQIRLVFRPGMEGRRKPLKYKPLERTSVFAGNSPTPMSILVVSRPEQTAFLRSVYFPAEKLYLIAFVGQLSTHVPQRMHSAFSILFDFTISSTGRLMGQCLSHRWQPLHALDSTVSFKEGQLEMFLTFLKLSLGETCQKIFGRKGVRKPKGAASFISCLFQ